jgi:hypothetical protein
MILLKLSGKSTTTPPYPMQNFKTPSTKPTPRPTYRPTSHSRSLTNITTSLISSIISIQLYNNSPKIHTSSISSSNNYNHTIYNLPLSTSNSKWRESLFRISIFTTSNKVAKIFKRVPCNRRSVTC